MGQMDPNTWGQKESHSYRTMRARSCWGELGRELGYSPQDGDCADGLVLCRLGAAPQDSQAVGFNVLLWSICHGLKHLNCELCCLVAVTVDAVCQACLCPLVRAQEGISGELSCCLVWQNWPDAFHLVLDFAPTWVLWPSFFLLSFIGLGGFTIHVFEGSWSDIELIFRVVGVWSWHLERLWWPD